LEEKRQSQIALFLCSAGYQAVIQQQLNTVNVRHSIDFNKTETAINRQPASAFIIREVIARIILTTVGMNVGNN
jgi:hypothetical protein